MDVSPNALRKATAGVLLELDKVEMDIRSTAVGLGKPSETLMDQNGNWVMAPILLAKAQCLHTLALLNEKKN